MHQLNLVTKGGLWLALSLLGVILAGSQARAATTMALVPSDTDVCVGNTFSLAQGTNTYIVTATDNAGNTSADSIIITYIPLAKDILINEVAFKETNDWIEIKVIDTGAYDGCRIYEGGTLIATIPDWGSLKAGDFIVIHEESGTNDTNKTDNNPGYWDIYEAGSLTGTDNIIQIKMAAGDDRRMDAVIYSNNNGKFTGNKTEANKAVADGHWDTGSSFSSSRDSDAWTDSDDVSTGQSIGRGPSSTDTNSRSDWAIKTLQTPGADNIIPPTANAGGPYSGNEVDTITLDAGASTDSDGNITLYEWDIDNDGTYEISTSDSSYACSWTDDYSGAVILRVTDNDSRSDTASASVSIFNRAPLASAGGPYFGEAGDAITLSASAVDSSPFDTFTYDWDLNNDGIYEILDTQNLSATWNDAGIYFVTLKVTDDDVGIDTDATEVFINDSIPPVVIITSPNNGHDTTATQPQMTISGSASDTGTGVVTVSINTSDTNTGDTADFSFLVTLNPDTNAFVVTAQDGAGNTATDTIGISYFPCLSLSADFTAGNTYGCAPLTVDFSDSSSGDVLSWLWDFGDGETSTVQNPAHTYPDSGDYTISLTVSDACGSDTKTDHITVNCCSTVAADFSSTPTIGCAPLPVNFNDSSTGPVLSWWWDFGDGATSSDSNPAHTYTDSGVYTVSLTVTDECESDSKVRTAYLTVALCLPDVRINEVAFKEVNDWIEFYIGKTSLGGLRVYKGTTLVKEFPDINAEAGDYAVLHFDGNPADDENDTTGKGANGYWDIYTSNLGLTGTDDIVRLQMPGTSLISPTNTLDAVIWSNNDGNFTGSRSVANDLVAAGLWEAGYDFYAGDSGAVIDSDDLTAGFSLGRDIFSTDDNLRANWSILPQIAGGTNCSLPASDFAAGNTSGCAPLSVCFNDSSMGYITGWSWDINGDGVSDTTVQNPCYIYDTPGSYSVSLTVSGVCGSDSEIKSDYIQVISAEIAAGFSITSTFGCAPLTICFSDTSIGDITNRDWDLNGDGISDTTVPNPCQTYDTGNYPVTLVVKGQCGQDSSQVSITVAPCEVDTTPPTSQVNPLPEYTLSTSFEVSWQGNDEYSGIWSYSIFYAEDRGEYQIWLSDTTAVSAIFIGAGGHTYSFYSLARDKVGNVEEKAAPSEAFITILDDFRIESEDGQAIGELSLNFGDTIAVYARGYSGESVMGPLSVTWEVTGDVGSVSPNQGEMTTFKAEHVGTGRIKARFEGQEKSTEPVTVIHLSKKWETCNYPNPFNPVDGEMIYPQDGGEPTDGTIIKYTLPEDIDDEVIVRIYTTTGELVKGFDFSSSEYRSKGEHYIAWDGQNDHGRMVAIGVYLYYIEAGRWKGIHKMAVVK